MRDRKPDRAIADDVLPAQIDTLAVPIALVKLFPWHRPRKQLVREEQWIRYSRYLIENERGKPAMRELHEGKTKIRYLTLPGIDYLDVRQLAALCNEYDCSLISTGFQSGEEGNPYVARAQLREKSLIDAGHITAGSYTFPRRFEDVAHIGGSAYRDLRRRGPFHIVNIDACGSIATPNAGHANRLVDALYRVVELQLELAIGRWLLFITTDVRPGSLSSETLDGLCRAIFENSDMNEAFRTRATPVLAPGQIDIRAAVASATASPGMRFLQLFSLGFAKWLLHLAHEKEWDIKTHHPYCYSTMPDGDATPSMACLAFEFLPPPPGVDDRFGVSRAEAAPTPNREDTSIRAADKIRDMSNADHRIASNDSLRIRMIESLRVQLADAGYEPAVIDGIA